MKSYQLIYAGRCYGQATCESQGCADQLAKTLHEILAERQDVKKDGGTLMHEVRCAE